MAFVDHIDEVLKRDLKSKLHINENDFDVILDIFITKILPLVEKNYLSHLKTAIENTINEKMKADLLNQIKMDSAISLSEKNQLELLVKYENFRPFTILFKPVIWKKKVSARRTNRSVSIYYDSRIEKKHLRIFLAHELGHIIIRKLCSDSQLENEENNASLFAFFAILDKDNFYKTNAKELIHYSDLELLNDVVSLFTRNQ